MNPEELLAMIEAKITEMLASLREEFASSEEVEATRESVEELKSLIKSVNPTDEIKTKLSDLEGILVKQGNKLNEIEKTPAKMEKPLSTKQALVKAFTSEDFRKVVEKDGTTSGNFKLVEKDYSFASGRTGTVMISEIRDYISSQFGRRKLFIRDLINVAPISQPNLVYDKVTAVTGFSNMYAENDELTASSFTTAEQTVNVKRLGNYQFVSNRAVKSASWAVDSLAALMESAILYKEDVAILYADGAGNEVRGIAKDARSISMTGASFNAGAFASVASYNGGAQALVTFAAAHGLVNGYNITIANATHAGYNTTFAVNVFSDTQILLNVAYVAEAANLVGAWTATTAYHLTDKIDNAGTVDAVMAAIAFMKSYDVNINGILMNPADAALIVTDKGTTGMPTANSYIFSVERRGMDLFIGGIPVIESNAVKAGDLFVGDWSAENIGLFEYTPVSLTVERDAEMVRKNKVQFSVDEEILFAVFNPYAFGYGDLTTIKADIEKP